MTLVIDATVGGASSNSFVTLAEATTYMEARLNGSTWTSATTDNQNRALVEATRELSSREYTGMKASSTQALQWPRSFAVNPDINWVGNPFYASDIIPQRVKDATCELAFQFLKAGTTDIAALDPKQYVTQKTVGPISTSYAEPFYKPQGLGRFPSVMRYIKPLLTGSNNSAEVIRG